MRLFLASSLSLSFLLLPACNGGGGGTGTDGGTDTSSTTETGSTTSTSTTSPTSSTTTDASGSGTATDSGTTTGTPTTGQMTTGTTEPGTTTGTTTTGMTTGMTGMMTGPDSTTTDTTGTTGEPAQCPPEPNDDECAMCLKASCCDALLACADNEDCTCFYDCLQQGNPQQCGQMCQINPMQEPTIGAVFMCTNDNCDQPCPP